jgi:hypothetical protein
VAVTVDDLAKRLGFAQTPADTQELERALAAARGIINPHLLTGDAFTPDELAVLDSATLTVAQDLWRRKDTSGGAFSFADGNDSIGYMPRDLLNSVWPMLFEAGLVGVVLA